MQLSVLSMVLQYSPPAGHTHTHQCVCIRLFHTEYSPSSIAGCAIQGTLQVAYQAVPCRVLSKQCIRLCHAEYSPSSVSSYAMQGTLQAAYQAIQYRALSKQHIRLCHAGYSPSSISGYIIQSTLQLAYQAVPCRVLSKLHIRLCHAEYTKQAITSPIVCSHHCLIIVLLTYHIHQIQLSMSVAKWPKCHIAGLPVPAVLSHNDLLQ